MARVTYDRVTGEYYATAETGEQIFHFWRMYAIWCGDLDLMLMAEFNIDLWGI